jgi:hypothetical protein
MLKKPWFHSLTHHGLRQQFQIQHLDYRFVRHKSKLKYLTYDRKVHTVQDYQNQYWQQFLPMVHQYNLQIRTRLHIPLDL